MSVIDLILDCGNANVKVALVENETVKATEVFPSILRETKDCNFVLGGFKLKDKTWVVGNDNEGRKHCIKVGELSRGKIDYLSEMVAGAISYLEHLIPVGSKVRLHFLTLQLDEREIFDKVVTDLEDLHIDGEPRKLKLEVASVAPEGLGCSVSAAKAWDDVDLLHVLDIGGGTANLTSYSTRTPLPKRRRFVYEPVGINALYELIEDELKQGSSNGKVDRTRLQQAVESNTYKMIEASYNGRDISNQVEQAIDYWLESPQFKELLARVIFLLQTGERVSCCGGGFMLTKVREAVETIIAANVENCVFGPEGTVDNPEARFLIPEKTNLLGVLGVAELVVRENSQRNEAKEKRRKAQKKTEEPNHELQTNEDEHNTTEA